MKIFSTIFLVFITLVLVGQTSETEYKYIKQGFKVQEDSGLDMKDGYVFVKSHFEYTNRGEYNRVVNFRFLVRTNTGEIAGIQMIFKRTDSKYEEYICIPSKNSDKPIWNLAKSDFKKAAENWSQASRDYSWGMFTMISELASKITFNKSKSTKYLSASNGEISNFLKNGTYETCPKCAYVESEYLDSNLSTYDKKYTHFKNFLELQDGTRLEFFEDGILSNEWKIYDGLIISQY